MTAAIPGAVPKAEAGIGSAANNAVARIAALVAVVFAGLVMGTDVTTQGLHGALIATAALQWVR